MKFRAELQHDGQSATGITVPTEVLDALGGGRRPAVTVTLNGHSYRTTVGVMGGVAKIPVSAAVRDAAGVGAGDILDVKVVADTTPRTIEVPGDLAAALAQNIKARAFFDQLSYSRQHAYVTWIEQAKQPATRTRRVEQAVPLLAESAAVRWAAPLRMAGPDAGRPTGRARRARRLPWRRALGYVPVHNRSRCDEENRLFTNPGTSVFPNTVPSIRFERGLGPPPEPPAPVGRVGGQLHYHRYCLGRT